MCLFIGPQGPRPRTDGQGPMAQDTRPRPQGPWPHAPGRGPKAHRIFRTTYFAGILTLVGETLTVGCGMLTLECGMLTLECGMLTLEGGMLA